LKLSFFVTLNAADLVNWLLILHLLTYSQDEVPTLLNA